MYPTATFPMLEHPCDNVNPPVNYQLPLFPDPVIHHNRPSRGKKKMVLYRKGDIGKRYGVSQDRRVLSPQLLLKRYYRVRDCLEDTVGLPPAQREAAIRLLRYWAYYGNVYVKESSVTSEPGCSKATYWRAVKFLESHGLITVINRYIIRPHAQISNLYKFDRLLLVIAVYLAEHGVEITTKWVQPYLRMPGSQFWPWILRLSPPRTAGIVPV